MEYIILGTGLTIIVSVIYGLHKMFANQSNRSAKAIDFWITQTEVQRKSAEHMCYAYWSLVEEKKNLVDKLRDVEHSYQARCQFSNRMEAERDNAMHELAVARARIMELETRLVNAGVDND